MKPTWEADGVTLYFGDCLDIAPKLPKVDALISDPPYGIGYYHSGGEGTRVSLKGGSYNALATSFSGKESMILGDDKPFDPSPWLNYPIVCLWGGNHYSDKLPKRSKWLIWDKIAFPQSYGKFSFSDCEMAWTSLDGAARIYQQLWQGCRRSGEGNERKLHPNQKPISLMEWCMQQVKVPVKATVLDPYMGSASTGVACIRTGRNFIGIEKDRNHFDNARRRMENELSQTQLVAVQG